MSEGRSRRSAGAPTRAARAAVAGRRVAAGTRAMSAAKGGPVGPAASGSGGASARPLDDPQRPDPDPGRPGSDPARSGPDPAGKAPAPGPSPESGRSRAGASAAVGAAVVDATVDALAEVLRLDGPADAALRRFFRARPGLGRRDRVALAETVFDVLRHRRRYGHLAQSMAGPLPRRLAALSLYGRYGDAALPGLRADADQAATLRAASAIDPDGLPQAVRLSLPDWLHSALLAQAAAAGEPDPALAVESLGRALLQSAPLDLRVNLLRTGRDALRAELAREGVVAEPLAEPQTALRVAGKPALERLAAFGRGDFEVQDAGSQRLVDFVAPRRGQTVVDFCAGAGGKTLAMAAAMRSTGQIYACDVSALRLARLAPRLARSGATNVQPLRIEHEADPRLRRLDGRAHRVLVDAPCTGTGTVRRNPELKWRLGPQDVAELARKQSSILGQAARLVARGGTLVYATCSLLREENEAVADAFGASHPGFEPAGAMCLRPEADGTDGFFATRWLRRE